MNFEISVLFRAIPLVMGAICLAFGLYILYGGTGANHFVAGHVNIALTAICYALFTTAATIIRQLVHRYGEFWRWALPTSGYVVSLAAIAYGIALVASSHTGEHIVAGHIAIGVGLIAMCVSTVATASTVFTLINVSAGRKPEDGPPDGAHTKRVALQLIAIPVICAIVGFVLTYRLLMRGDQPGYVAGHVVFGLSAICLSLTALVATIVRQIRNEFTKGERMLWSWLVIVMGSINILLGIYVLISNDHAYRLAPGIVLIGLGLICFSILSKALLLALVWRRSFPLANRIPLLPVLTALTCLFAAAFLFEASDTNAAYFVPSRVMVGLGAVCFTLFSIVSILEAGTSGSGRS
ncbi:DUF2776 family protein [Hyphomicrobium sp.]|uniref:DUF2776 family protein n=1 Tax=Hyphomicrobium sp. TaxID=82 RepID=UPI002D791CBB|nr:DUF2776 family protein [Hyphomicrobium sp.]HET6389211.1 DUF2776 family protein [Hyphomicrobium sp.]